MGARKGYRGESCDEAIRSSITAGEVVACSELYSRVKARGTWSDDTIWRHFMARTVNLVPARHHYSGRRQILFLRPEGQYELYDERKHPRIIE